MLFSLCLFSDVEIEGDVIDIIVGQQPLLGGVVPYIELVLDYQTLSDDAIDSSLVLYLPQNVFGKPTSSVGGDCISEGGGNHRCLLEPIFSNYEGVSIGWGHMYSETCVYNNGHPSL